MKVTKIILDTLGVVIALVGMKCTCKHEVASKTFFTAFENKNPIHSRLESISYTRQTWGFEPDCVLERYLLSAQ